MEVIKEMRLTISLTISLVSMAISTIALYRLSILEACMRNMTCLHNGGP